MRELEDGTTGDPELLGFHRGAETLVSEQPIARRGISRTSSPSIAPILRCRGRQRLRARRAGARRAPASGIGAKLSETQAIAAGVQGPLSHPAPRRLALFKGAPAPRRPRFRRSVSRARTATGLRCRDGGGGALCRRRRAEVRGGRARRGAVKVAAQCGGVLSTAPLTRREDDTRRAWPSRSPRSRQRVKALRPHPSPSPPAAAGRSHRRAVSVPARDSAPSAEVTSTPATLRPTTHYCSGRISAARRQHPVAAGAGSGSSARPPSDAVGRRTGKRPAALETAQTPQNPPRQHPRGRWEPPATTGTAGTTAGQRLGRRARDPADATEWRAGWGKVAARRARPARHLRPAAPRHLRSRP